MLMRGRNILTILEKGGDFQEFEHRKLLSFVVSLRTVMLPMDVSFSKCSVLQ